VVTGGFKSRLNLGLRKLQIVGGCLYGVTANHDQGMEVWRTRDGEHWEVVSQRGFGHPRNTSGRGLAGFRGMLYVGTENRKARTEIWRSADGIQWEQVVSRGGGDPIPDISSGRGRSFGG
jgi:hypothetical protein